MVKLHRMLRLCLLAALVAWPSFFVAQERDKIARVGVLAFRGVEEAQAHWGNLALYLDAQIGGWQFEIVPVSLVSAPEKIAAGEIDFLITNPGHFTSLATDHPLSVLATLERPVPGQDVGLLSYGTVIFARRDTGFRALGDLEGKTLAAVSPEAFGGFQIAWNEMMLQNIDPFLDLRSIRFMGFPQDAIVTSVFAQEVDAGVIRSGLLESLDEDGTIELDDFIVLSGRSQPNYPFLVSGHLYPEWPFLALSGSDRELNVAVALALLRTRNAQIIEEYELSNAWSAPLSYESVRKLVIAYEKREIPQRTERNWSQIVPGITFLVGAFLAAFGTWFFARGTSGRHADEQTSPLTDNDEEGELKAARSQFDALTRRERQVLAMICAGRTSKEIAENLGISPKTVEFHRANLLQKTKAGTTAHLVQLTTRLNLNQGFFLGETS